jgi:hypothetical protein
MIEENHPTDETPNAPATIEPTDEELWVRATVQKYFGGEKPIHVSTLYRGIDTGIYPPPINVSPNVVRWLPHECRAARQRMLSARGEPKAPSPRRGRKRGASRAEMEAQIMADNLEIHRRICALIWHSEANGETIDFVADTPPEAVLCE